MVGLTGKAKTLFLTALFLCAGFFGSAAPSSAAAHVGAALSGHSNSSNEVVKILSILESRTTDRTVLDKAADKLNAMGGRRLRILSKLSDRIAEDADAAGADIAFSLMTVLIVLS